MRLSARFQPAFKLPELLPLHRPSLLSGYPPIHFRLERHSTWIPLRPAGSSKLADPSKSTRIRTILDGCQLLAASAGLTFPPLLPALVQSTGASMGKFRLLQVIS